MPMVRLLGPSEPLRNSLHVRVDDDAFGAAKATPRTTLAVLRPTREAPRARQRPRNVSAVLGHQLDREPDDVLRLLPKHPDAAQDLLDFVRLGSRERRRVGYARNKSG